MTTEKKVWALLDERQGNTSQTLGVAEALGLPFEIKQIEFNHLVRLPNPLIYKTTIGVKETSRPLLTPPWPDIVISTARRLGLVASYIKSQSPQTFLAQIQWPGFPSRHFDLIAAPRHDNAKPAPNLITTLGAPHRVTENTLKREADIWRKVLNGYPTPTIALLVGGSAKGREFGAQHAKMLAILASEFTNSLGGSLFITTSRRTGKDIAPTLSQHLTCPHYMHIWRDEDDAKANPFYGFLGLADAVIATGDSISMCSEACATGKSVYVYASNDFMSPKHRQFVNDLFEQGLAKPLPSPHNALFAPPYRLDDSLLIADEIRKRIAIP